MLSRPMGYQLRVDGNLQHKLRPDNLLDAVFEFIDCYPNTIGISKTRFKFANKLLEII